MPRKIRELIQDMKDSDRYVKIVEWSDEDQCYIGSSPGLFFGGCHGDDEQQVFDVDSVEAKIDVDYDRAYEEWTAVEEVKS